MPKKSSYPEVPLENLRWRLDPATLPFKTTDDLKPLKEIIGQKRAVEAFKFGMGIDRQGYNVFVTGRAGTGRMSTVKKLLEDPNASTEAIKQATEELTQVVQKIGAAAYQQPGGPMPGGGMPGSEGFTPPPGGEEPPSNPDDDVIEGDFTEA